MTLRSAPAEAEFESFVRSAWPTLRQAAFALAGNRADAEDLLQTVLTRTYARWHVVGRDDPVAYVRRALLNAYVDTWRRRRVLREEPTEVVPERRDPRGRAGPRGRPGRPGRACSRRSRRASARWS